MNIFELREEIRNSPELHDVIIEYFGEDNFDCLMESNVADKYDEANVIFSVFEARSHGYNMKNKLGYMEYKDEIRYGNKSLIIHLEWEYNRHGNTWADIIELRIKKHRKVK